ncbi:MAG: hypothetical protein JWP63_5190 [Candidatus Solibacter sp.]|nr:hypothetical protein [Candidatus Solibacter sp.]
MTSTVLVSVLKAILLIGSALMAFRLYRTGLYRLYPVFFAYFTFRIPNAIWPLLLNGSSGLYQQIWLLTEPIVLGFYILMVRELYRLVLAKYKGLYTLGRWAMYTAMTVSVIISAISLLPTIKPSAAQRSKVMIYVLATERGVNTALSIFIVLLILFLSRYPVRLSRNVRVYAVIYSLFFLSNMFVVLMRSLFGLKMVDEVNIALMGVAAVCLVAWLLLLSPNGAELRLPEPTLGPQYEHRLLTQLDSLNAALLKVGHRDAPRAISSKR